MVLIFCSRYLIYIDHFYIGMEGFTVKIFGTLLVNSDLTMVREKCYV